MARQTVSELVVRVGSDVEEALNGLNKLSVGAQRMGRQVSRTGRNLTRNLTVPIAAVGAAGFKLASDLETSFARMEGLVGVQRSQLDEWEGEVRGLAVTYGQSASKAADALFFITSAGLEGSDAMDALDASMKASAAGLGEISTIADLTTSAMNAYGSDVLSAAQATDVLTAAVREGKLEPEALAGSMGRVIPIASAMGIQFHEVGAAMAAMSRTGTRADEAATQLRSIMTSLIKPTTDAEGALAGMGLSAGGLRSQIKDQGLLSVLQTLAQEFEGNDEAAAKVFGNVRALSGVLDLMGSNAEDTAGIFRDMTGATGATDDAFAAMAETAGFKLTQALAAGKDLLITIGHAVLPVVVQILEKTVAAIRPVADWFQNLDPRIQRVIVVVGALVAAIGPLLLGLGGIITAGGTLVGVVTSVGAVLAGVTAPVATVVAALVGLTAAFVVAYKESETFRDIVNKAVDVTRKAVGKALGLVMEVAADLAEHFSEIAEEIVETLEVRLIDPFNELWDMWGEEIMAVASFVFGRIASTIRTAFDVIKALVKGALGVISGAIQLGLNLIQGDWSEAWGDVEGVAATMKTTVVEIVTALVDAIKEQFGAPLRAIVDKAGEIKDGVVGKFQEMKDVIVGNSIVPDMVTDVVDEFKDMKIDSVAEAADLVTDVVGEFEGLESGIMSAVEKIPGPLGDALGEIAEKLHLGGIIGDIGKNVTDWVDTLVGIGEALKTLWDIWQEFGDTFIGFLSHVSGGGRAEFGEEPGGGGGFDPTGGAPIPGPVVITDEQGLPAGTMFDFLGTQVAQLAQITAIMQATHQKLVIDGWPRMMQSLRGSGAFLSTIVERMNIVVDQLKMQTESLKMLAAPATGTVASGQVLAGPGIAAAGAGGVSVENHFHGAISGLTADQIGAAVSQATVEALDSELGRRRRTQQSAVGSLRTD